MSRRVLLLLLFCIAVIHGNAQVVTECPQNIGFERGLLTNWVCSVGEISQTGTNTTGVRPAVITLNNSGPLIGQHTIIKRSDKTDYYGQFSTNAPNGSDYVLMLGDECNGRGAERISYTINVPANVDTYSIVFNYAVVFESPTHDYDEQPKFTARVFEVSSNTSTACGSFEFVASGALPDFKVSPFQSRRLCGGGGGGAGAGLGGGGFNANVPVLYKDWSPVFVNLTDYIGKTIRMEFTTNDCSRGGHFGYAYIDFDENCSIPLSGNITCPEAESITLRTLPGFFGYRWYKADNLESLGNADSLLLSPIPEAGTRIAVELIPYSGLGCRQTLYTTIGGMNMSIIDPPPDCTSVDLTDISLKVGNSSDLTYSYWTDSLATKPLLNPRAVLVSGTYYIRGRSSSGCTLTKPVQVLIGPIPPKIPEILLQAVYPSKVDITKAFLQDEGISYSFWLNSGATLPIPDPTRIGKTGDYFIKSTSLAGCVSISAFSVEIIISDYAIPNTFSPNNDGVNDLLTVLISNKVQVKHFKIFNRWGDVVYVTTDINNYWNGFRNNAELPVGVYYWVIEGILDSKRYYRSGYVTLLR